MTHVLSPSPTAEPAWGIARTAPNQGTWTEDEYLAFDENVLVEFSDGLVEFLPVPTTSHQIIMRRLTHQLDAFVDPRQLGLLLPHALRVRIAPRKFREPDLVFMLQQNLHRAGEKFWEGADLVVEVVSPDGRKRDLEVKRREYAQAGIAEYWIVDPQASSITVLKLDNANYVEHGVFGLGQTASSVLLAGFTSDVSAVFNAAKIASL